MRVKAPLIIILLLFSKIIYAQQNIDATSIYPPNTLESKGILLNPSNFQSWEEENWWRSTEPYTLTLYSENHPMVKLHASPTGKNTYILLRGDTITLNIPLDPLRVWSQDDEFYYISGSYTEHNAVLTNYMQHLTSFGIKKSEIEALGFRYFSLHQYMEALHMGRFKPIGANILRPLDLLPFDVHPDMKYHSFPHVQHVYFILRTAPSDESPFISIIEPGQPQVLNLLQREGDWYKLEMQTHFGWGNVFTDAGYHGQIYTGYWKPPIDKNGFPVALIEAVDSREWHHIVEKLCIQEGITNCRL